MKNAAIASLLAACALVVAPPASAQSLAYVANDIGNTVSVVDTATNTVVTNISVGANNNPQNVVVTPDGAFVYVANNTNFPIVGGGSVSVVSTATNTVVATIATGGGPYGIAITPDGHYVYVSNFYDLPANNVWVIDTATNTIVDNITVGASPHGMAIGPDGAFLYVTNAQNDSVSIVEVATNTVVGSIAVGDLPHGIALSPSGHEVWVSNHADGTISVIDSSTSTVVATITMATPSIEGIVFSLDGLRAYVCHQNSDFVSVLDTVTRTVVATVTTPFGPFGGALTADGAFLYVPNQGAASVSVISTATNTLVETIHLPPGSWPVNVAIAPAAAATHVVGPGVAWLGLKNSDDQGTRFDLRLEIYRNGGLISSGLTRCIAGVTRNPNLAREVSVALPPSAAYASGETISIVVLARIGTNPDDTKCPGHNNGTGLRLYYDGQSRPTRVGFSSTSGDGAFYLHTIAGSDALDAVTPSSPSPKFKDSPPLNFAGGNAWRSIGTWSGTMQ